MARLLSYAYGALTQPRCSRWKNFRTTTIMILVTMLIGTLYISNMEWSSVESDTEQSEYPPFEPEITYDFPTVHKPGPPRIPHIIHQTYKSEMIPSYYVKYVQSFVEMNPDWDYYFWTDDSARELVAKRHPNLLYLWDSYVHPVNRADVLRYVVLYEFGGFYADLDVECLRPLDRLTYKYACVFPPEPFEMTAVVNNWPYFINNAIMMCRPKHPFLKQMIDNLQAYQPMDNIIDQAGPAFVTSQYLFYNNLKYRYRYSKVYSKDSNSPFFYQGMLSAEHEDAVYVPNSKYFFNKLDDHHNRIKNLQNRCSTDVHKLLFNQRRACNELKKRLSNKKNAFAFTEHHWLRSYELPWLNKLLTPNLDIKVVVKRVQVRVGL